MSEHHGKIWWSELMTDDPEAAKDWYATHAGWTYTSMDMGGGSGPYNVAHVDGQPMAGIMPRPDGVPKEVPAHWLTYVAVSDVDATAKAAPTTVQEPFDVPGVGRIAVIVDAGGATVGIMTPAG